ncbi:hypothetical protein Tco_0976309 [Tanacetum coccineum]|uniref:Uncharacterized protein n=1 Tax=Tanacetum coccineum TaxID=301880 RepID=A0ABQ5EHA5_9ASTR
MASLPTRRVNSPSYTSIKARPVLISTDISEISRKPSKTSKHGHEKRKSTRDPKDSEPEAKVKKSTLVKPQSTKEKDKNSNVSI